MTLAADTTSDTTETKAISERVLIVEDEPAARVGLEQLVKSWGFLAESAGDGEEALDKVTTFRPAIVITDLVMPRLDGLRTARELKIKGFAGSIIFLTVQEDDDYLSAALAAGARGYVLKSRMRTDLLHAIDEALAGKTFVSSSTSRN